MTTNKGMSAGEKNLHPAVKLLADVMHLWIDGYISKNPHSMAPNSISSDTFDAIQDLLASQEITVDYCGWRIDSQSAGENLKLPELPPMDDQYWRDKNAWDDADNDSDIACCYAGYERDCRERQLLASLKENALLQQQLAEKDKEIERLQSDRNAIFANRNELFQQNESLEATLAEAIRQRDQALGKVTR